MFYKRLKHIKETLKKEKLDAVFLSNASNITYLSGYSNFSKDEREAYIFLGPDFGYIITDGRYSEAIKKEVPHLKLFERGGGKSTEELFKKHKSKIKSLGIEEDNLTVSEHKVIKKHFKNIKHIGFSNLRSIKDKEEVEKIKKACEIGDLAFKYILKKLKVGVSEKEIAQILKRFIEGNNAEISFPAIVAFGKNSSVPHHQTGKTILGPESSSGREGLIILLDFGVKWENYCSDMTRTVFFGEPSSKQKEIYNIVLEAQKKAIDYINSQIKLGKKIKTEDADKTARDYIIKKGYPSIPHSLGHGIGLEVHEQPYISIKSKEELKKGMVFSIEPGIYIENFGGVRIEDLYILGKDRLEQITNSSKELVII